MPFLDEEISQALAEAMNSNGIHIHWNAPVTGCDTSENECVRVILSSGEVIECDAVLVCAGRESNTTTLNLEGIGVELGKRGLVPVNQHYQTVVPNVYAAGDVIGAPALAATGIEQARVAVAHAFQSEFKRDVAAVLPSGIYSIPEASMVGETERSLREKGVDVIVGRSRYADLPRGEIIGDETGFLKLVFRRDDMRLLGVHVVGEHATELVHIGMIAMLADADAALFNRACFNYPTLGDLYKYAAYEALAKRDALI
jgi:NAD(P) transhydrogenase